MNSIELERGIFAKFHINKNLNEADKTQKSLSGILRLIFIKYISSFIKDVNQINSNEIKKIILVLKKGMKQNENVEEDIKSNLMENSGRNILAYAKYVCSIITDKNLKDLLGLLESNIKQEIIKFWNILSLYEEINNFFEVETLNAIKNSYFEYSLIGLSMYQQNNRIKFLESMNKCPNMISKFLFHGTHIEPISKIITNGFLYPRKTFNGMGIGFSDMLDYTLFFSGGKDFFTRRAYFGCILPVDTTFSCVSSEVYYSQGRKRDIYDYSLYIKCLDHFPTYEEIKRDYPDKMVEKNGVHYTIVEPRRGQIRKREEIDEDIKKGKFLGTEYVITEKEQILPLYGLTFKRNEYLIIWRDPHFNGANDFHEFLEEKKLFIYQYAKLNVYFESSIEEALEIIKTKQFNKIILISNIGLDLSGKKFVEIAREILGFKVMVLFYSKFKNHLSWIKNFPNALFTDNDDFYHDYILNYNEKGLYDLKRRIELYYNIQLIFEKDILRFPKFINSGKFDDICFEQTQNFKKIIIKNSENNSILCMDKNGKIIFKSSCYCDINLYIWYITIMENEITLFSNGYYLGANIQSKNVIGEKYMKVCKLEKIKNNEYLIYFNDKNNVLTINGNNPIIYMLSPNYVNQKFKFIEYYSYI